MQIVMWVLFAIEALFRYGPSFFGIIKDIIKAIEEKKTEDGQPLPAEQKRLEFEAMLTKAWIKKHGAAPTYKMIVDAREWGMQAVNGRKWQCEPRLALRTGLSRYYA
jgi:hypothetical protein